MTRRFTAIAASVLSILWSGSALIAAEAEAVFKLQEVSVFDEADHRDFQRFTRGQSAQCNTEPDEKIKVYPKLKSDRPYYGTVVFNRNFHDPGSGIEFHFVVDESGEKGRIAVSPAKTPEPSMLDRLAEALTGNKKKKAVSAPVTATVTYDRLYFDANRDLDLTNDPVLSPLAEISAGALPQWTAKQKVPFDYLTVRFDAGDDLGVRPCRMLPRLTVSEYEGKEYASVGFVSTKLRKGDIQVGPRRYHAVLAQPYVVSNRFDQPFTGLYLTAIGFLPQRSHWLGADQLSAMRQIDGKYYSTSCTPAGDKLTVKRYDGEFGVLEIGAGGRKIEKLSVQGSLHTQTAAISVGTQSVISGQLEPARQCRLPVGDYAASLLRFEFGRLRIQLSENYHSDGHPRDRQNNPFVYGIKIRKEKPFVLDFSNEPEVMFASPAKDQTFKPDDEITVKAVLTDPVLDIMIRHLDDTTSKDKQTIKLSDGRTRTSERNLSLDPVVKITNSADKVVGEGKMPFG